MVGTSLNSVVVGELTFSFVRIAEGVKIGGMANRNFKFGLIFQKVPYFESPNRRRSACTSAFQVLVRTAAATKRGHEPPPASSNLQHLCTVPASRLDSRSPLTFFRQLTTTLVLSAAQIPPKPVLVR